MTDSIRIVEPFLDNETFSSLAWQLMSTPSYQPLDYTVNPSEKDGSIDAFGEQECLDKSKLHEAIFNFTFYKKFYRSEFIDDFYYQARKQLAEVYKRLNVKKMFMLRANCTTALLENKLSAFHRDLEGNPEEEQSKTCILYLNTNNGGTQFKTGEFVRSRANTAVIFPATKEHAGVWCTNRKLRFVLNINYTEKE